ncbi:hypothetical protein GCM10009665_49520 [Kitasatospora nipponensis]|uniref:Uncharacterized protein n=1 Tax=Kitasatospora nipponensis TaxID=258049 RepID=A0ABN1WLR2_9ACTN
MSGHGVIGVLNADGSYRGRYVHSCDPGTAEADLWAILTRTCRGDLAELLRVLTEDHYGWSYLRPSQPDVSRVTPPAAFPRDAPHDSVEFVAYELSPEGSFGDGRFAGVPGFGVAYTTVEDQSHPERWETGRIGERTDTSCDHGWLFTSTEARSAELVLVRLGRTAVELGRVAVRELGSSGRDFWEGLAFGRLSSP